MLIVAHEVVVMCLRYLIENLDEAQILAIDREGDVANCGVTEYELRDGAMQLVRFNFVVPLEEQGVTVTTAKDLSFAPR